jgi:hypothetical protein
MENCRLNAASRSVLRYTPPSFMVGESTAVTELVRL